MEIVKELGEHAIVNLYADSIDGTGLYGDIYLDEEDVKKEHPESKIVKGFGIVNKETGISPTNSEDWYLTIEDADIDLNHIDFRLKKNK